MARTPCDDVRNRLWRYVDRELSGREIARVSRHLHECDECRKLFDAWATETSRSRQAFSGAPFGDGFVRRFRSRLDVEARQGRWSASGHPRGRVRPAAGGSAWSRGRYASLVASVLLLPVLVVVFLFLGRSSASRVGEFRVDEGRVGVSGGSEAERDLTVRERGWVRPGTRFDVHEGSRLVLLVTGAPEGSRGPSRVEVEGPASFRVLPAATSDRFLARLALGRLEAHVRPLGGEEVFEITTPDAMTRVVGTRFTIEVTSNATRLSVSEGTVALAAVSPRLAGSIEWRHVTREAGPHIVRAGGQEPEPLASLDPLGEAAEGLSPEPGAASGPAGVSSPPVSAPAEEAGETGVDLPSGTSTEPDAAIPDLRPGPADESLDNPVGTPPDPEHDHDPH